MGKVLWQMSSPSRRRATLAAIAAALALLCAACGSASPPPQRVVSAYETATGRHIVRDCGYSVPLPGRARRSLWLFCDTLVTGRHGKELGNPILGAGTAAEGPYTAGRAPGELTEVATPSAGLPPAQTEVATPAATASPGPSAARASPQPFLPVPANLTLPASLLPCTGPRTYPARWITGAAREPGPSGHVLISYADYCVSGRDVFTPEAFGLLDYDPVSNVLSPPAQVFTTPGGWQLPQQQVLGSPVFRGGYLYLFGSCVPRQGCGRGGIFLARTLAAAGWWDNGFSYQYWTGHGWSASLLSAASLLPGHAAPLAASADVYPAGGHGLIMIEQTSAAGDFGAWRATAPTGPWREIMTGRVPCGKAPRGSDPADLCRALIGHPELSTAKELLISFFNPGDNHVEISAYPW